MADPQTHRFEPVRYWSYFGPHEPGLTISSGDTVIVESPRDCHRYNPQYPAILEEMVQSRDDTVLFQGNPVVGPIYVKEAELGDSLEVEILGIELTRPYAYSRIIPHFASLTGEDLYSQHMLLNEPLPEMVFDWDLDTSRNVCVVNLPNSKVKRVEMPLEPMIGCIAVAPQLGWIEPTLSQGNYGGNLDCPDVREGTTVILPVWVTGAYLTLGDVHARQGDGELTGSGMETTARLTVRVRVAKDKPVSWPRIIDDTHIMSVVSLRPLTDAVKTAAFDLLAWLMDDYGYSKWEGWEVLTHAVTLRICNHVSPKYTVAAKFPRRYLPGI
jgi:acetamidase/formamidase